MPAGSSIGVFLQVFVEIAKFEGHSHGLFNFSKKHSANRLALKTKFIFNSSLLFSKNFRQKVCVGIALFQNFVSIICRSAVSLALQFRFSL